LEQLTHTAAANVKALTVIVKKNRRPSRLAILATAVEVVVARTTLRRDRVDHRIASFTAWRRPTAALPARNTKDAAPQ
jgi:hypothetical protein